MSKFQGLVGITSELKLWRFGNLTKLLQRYGGKIGQKTLSIIGDEIKIRTRGTLERQFSIMQRLGLVEGTGNIQTLTGSGRALSKLSTESKALSLKEKIFFFKLLFTSVSKEQLSTLLRIISEGDGSSRRHIIINFFNTNIANSLWETAPKNVKKLEETGKMSSFLTNKFGCLSGWLEELSLIEIKDEKIYSLTNSKIIESLSSKNIDNVIYELIVKKYSIQARKFNPKIDSKTFKKYFEKAYKIFEIGSENFSDIKAIEEYLFVILLLDEGIIMEKQFFEPQTEILASKGVIRSILLGRDGKPSHVIM